MSIRQSFLGIALLATSGVVFAQAVETKPPDAGSSGTASSQSSTIPAPNPCGSTAKALDQTEILTDTMGVDFGPYLTRITQIVRQNWYGLMPPSVYPPDLERGKVFIEFVIVKDGKVNGMKVNTSSGDVALDRAAWESITASNPFPPLPKAFPGNLIGLRFYYFYNLPLDISPISISPCGDIRIPAGSTLQFSASRKGIPDSSVTWSVSGPGCSKSDCGAISVGGLYTAPENIPGTPTVIVQASSRKDTSERAKSRITIVQVNPSH